MKKGKSDKKAIHEKLAYQYFQKLLNKNPKQPLVDDFHILSHAERQKIKKVERRTYLLAGIYGVLGVIVLYIPYWLFPELFPDTLLKLPFIKEPIKVPLVFMIYGFVLVFFELLGLTILNLQVVNKIAHICRFPDPNDPHFEEHIDALFIVGMEKSSKSVLSYGIDPYAGVPKWSIMLFTLAFTLKATLSNMLVKFVFRKLTARLAIRAYADLMGIPVFAFWNIYATYLVIRRAKIRIMASSLVKRLDNYLIDELGLGDNPEFRSIVYDTMQFVAQNKRDFHDNHFLMARNLIQAFDLEVHEESHKVEQEEFFGRVLQLKQEEREGFLKIFLFGMLIDGDLSRSERKMIDEMYQKKMIKIESTQMKTWTKAFVKGDGLEDFFTHTIGKHS